MLGLFVWLAGVAGAAPGSRAMLDTFQAEADARGVAVDTAPVRVRTVARLEDAGFCRQDTRPTILLRRSTWRALDHPAREALLFHELGHCLLDARHDNARGPTGEWRSLMRGGRLPAGKRAWIRFEGAHRTAYLDALFGVGPAPAWGEAMVPLPEGAETRFTGDTQRPRDGVAQLHDAAGFQGMWLALTPAPDGTKGLLVQGDRTLFVGMTPEHGVVVGTLEGARPWTNHPEPAGELWVFSDETHLWVGADAQTLLVLPRSELGAVRRVGAYSTGAAALQRSDVLTLLRAP